MLPFFQVRSFLEPGEQVYTANADTVCYLSGSTETCPGIFAPGPFATLGAITNTNSGAKSLYRGITFGVRKRFSHHFQFDAQYTYSKDYDNDSNERDPFTFRYANLYNLAAEYSLSDRDEAHKFNAYGLGDLPWGFKGTFRIQQHSAEPETDNVFSTGTGAPCSRNNSATRFVDGVDCGRNHQRKDNAFFVLDFGVYRPFHIGDKYLLVPRVEVFNTFNNTNNINPLSTPALFNFDGFLRARRRRPAAGSTFAALQLLRRRTLAELRNEVGEEEEQEGGTGEGKLLALEVAGAAGGHAREQRHAQGEAAEEAADMGVVVDADDAGEVGADTDDQVQHGELDDGAAETVELKGRDRQLLVREQDDKDTGDAEDRS